MGEVIKPCCPKMEKALRKDSEIPIDVFYGKAHIGYYADTMVFCPFCGAAVEVIDEESTQ